MIGIIVISFKAVSGEGIMTRVTCPQCANELQRSGELMRHCDTCQLDYRIDISCTQCGAPLQRLKACGAVNFWCDTCNELKSKKSAVYKVLSA